MPIRYNGNTYAPKGFRLVKYNGEIRYQKEVVNEYLSFEAKRERCYISYETFGGLSGLSMFVSDDDGETWAGWNGDAIQIEPNTKILVVNEVNQLSVSSDAYLHFNMGSDGPDGRIAVAGNIMSLLNFSNSLQDYCFYHLFEGCQTLGTPPKLPATTMAKSSYNGMFRNCTNLTQAPQLPATILDNNCYFEMFRDCTSLTTPPALPATTLFNGCYSYMFSGCTSLTTIPDLNGNILADECYGNMFSGCTSLTDLSSKVLPAQVCRSYSYAFMFQNCTGLTKTPHIQLVEIASDAYDSCAGMFEECSSLNEIKIDITNSFSDFQYSGAFFGWVYNVPPYGTMFYNGPDDERSENGIPETWSVVPF